jgi:hypothetical protein
VGGDLHFEGEGSSENAFGGELRFRDLHGLRSAFPTVASRRRGSIPMSRSYGLCEEIPKSVTPALWG